jgi:hypothetical protein
MVLVEVNKNGTAKKHIDYKHDEAYATTASFVNVIDVTNYENVENSSIVIHNQAAGDLDYEILAAVKNGAAAPTGTNDDDKSYTTLASGSIATTAAPVRTNITDAYSRVVVRLKHTTLTTTAYVWYKGDFR